MKRVMIVCLVCLVFCGVVVGISRGKNKEGEEAETTVEQEVISKEEEKALEIFEEFYAKAEKIVSQMTLEEKVSQLFLVRYPGTSSISEVTSNAPGGYILFGKDFKNKTKEEIKMELASLQKQSKIPLLLAVDEEGGTVVRVSAYSNFRNTPFMAPQKFEDLESLLKEAEEKTALLKSIGINMNLAPVVDVTNNTKAFIYPRTYGKSAEETAIYTRKLISQMNQEKMISSMKHFPGYGDNVDTHTGIAIDNRSMEEFQTVDFLPFVAGIESKAPAILVNHNVIKCMDDVLPATLSKKVHDVLRETLHFSGIIITDDLAMDAVKNYVENGEAAVQAVLAGNDLIITSSFTKHRNEVLTAVEEGKISEEVINRAVKRILAMKLQFDIL